MRKVPSRPGKSPTGAARRNSDQPFYGGDAADDPHLVVESGAFAADGPRDGLRIGGPGRAAEEETAHPQRRILRIDGARQSVAERGRATEHGPAAARPRTTSRAWLSSGSTPRAPARGAAG